MRLLAAIAMLLALTTSALAQAGCAAIATGAVLTAAQWNACFTAKQNAIGYTPVNKAGDTMLGRLTTIASSAGAAGLNLPPGAAPTSPNNGDIWTTAGGLYVRINGTTVGPLVSAITGSPWNTSGSDIYNSNAGNVGVNTSTPGSRFEVNGSVRLAGGAIRIGTVVTVTGSTTLSTTNSIVLCDATSGAVVSVLPAAAMGQSFNYKKIDSSANSCTLSGTIDGGSSYVLTHRYEAVTVVANASQWYLQ